jgi:hypothetical protein
MPADGFPNAAGGRDALTAAGHELDDIAAELTAVHEDLQPAMIAARAVLARFAPSIAQLAKNAAAEVRKLEEQTLEAADNSDASTPQPNNRSSPNFNNSRNAAIDALKIWYRHSWKMLQVRISPMHNNANGHGTEMTASHSFSHLPNA